MGLDNIPKPYPCIAKSKAVYDNNGSVDCEKTIKTGNCEFGEANNPLGIFSALCWFRGKTLVRELQAIGYHNTEFLYKNMDSEELSQKADELEKYLNEFKKKHSNHKEKVIGAGWNSQLKDNNEIEWEQYSDYDDIVEIIEKGINWLRKISSIGCEVEAWY